MKYLTEHKPPCPDADAIVTLLESIGYRVKYFEPQWGGSLGIVLTRATEFKPKSYGIVRRKIMSRTPLYPYSSAWYRPSMTEGDPKCEVFFMVELDRSRSIAGINDLLSTYEVSA